MNLEYTYKMMEQNGNKCAIVETKDGGVLTKIETNSSEDLIRQLREWEPAFSSYRKLIFRAGKTMATCSVSNGNIYEVDFPFIAQTISAPPKSTPAADVNNTLMGMMISMMKENNATVLAMQEKVTNSQIEAVRNEMKQLKTKKGDIEEFGDVMVKMEPLLSRWFGKGGAPVQNAAVRGPGWATNATAPKNKLSFEEMKAKPENEQVDIFMAEFKTLQDKMNPVDATALLTLANMQPEKISKIVYALLEKPDYIDTAVSLLSK